jgi:dienelactone hydrolase
MRVCVLAVLTLCISAGCRGREPNSIRQGPDEGEGEGEGEPSELGIVALADLVTVGALDPSTPPQQRLDAFAAFEPTHARTLPTAVARARMRTSLSEHPVSQAWRDHVPAEPAIFDAVSFDDYDVSVVHLELLPQTWVPAVLYRPKTTEAPVPAVLALNGHSDTVDKLDVQRRAIQLARRGFAVLQLEWYRQGQLDVDGQSHSRLSQHELCGVPSHAAFIWSVIHAVDVLEQLPDVDATRIGTVGLSGGGWQALWLGALDERIQWANVVAGVAAYRDRAELDSALGDQEQAPSDLYLDGDYADLVALVAPRPLLLTYNSNDEWFPADPCLDTLVDAAAPRYASLGAAGRLHSFVSRTPGTHVMRTEAFEALFRFINAENLATDFVSPVAVPVDDELLTVDDLTAEIGPGITTLNDLAQTICADLPRDGGLPEARLLPAWSVSRRAALGDVLRDPERSQTWPVGRGHTVDGAAVSAFQGEVDGMGFSAVVVTPAAAQRLVVLLADNGRPGTIERAQRHLDDGDAVALLSPPHIGDASVGTGAWLSMLMEQAIGRRPLGMQVRALLDTSVQLALDTGLPVVVDAAGARTSLIALAAAALEPALYDGVRVSGALASFRALVDDDRTFNATPEWFTFGMLEHFEVEQLVAMAAPTPIVVAEDSIRAAWAEALALGR